MDHAVRSTRLSSSSSHLLESVSWACPDLGKHAVPRASLIYEGKLR